MKLLSDEQVLFADDIADWPALVRRLRGAGDPVSAWLQWRLSEATARDLEQYAGGPPSRELIEHLIGDLNGLVAGPPLEQEEPFQSMPSWEVGAADQESAEPGLEADDAQRLRRNWALLAQALGGVLHQQPYVGPRSFELWDEPRFFGRAREANEFAARIIANPEVLLYAPSGAGKTSLLNAKLVPALEREGCDVLPATRVQEPAAEPWARRAANLYMFSALLRWTKVPGLCEDPPDPQELAGMSLSDFLARREQPEDEFGIRNLRVLIFDQFEELFTFYPGHWQERAGFFQQLRDALRGDASLRIVLSMREDYLAELDPYLAMLPERLSMRFRLERLRPQAALEAIRRPLLRTPRSFAPGVAEDLVERLREVEIQTLDGQPRTIIEEFVEPVQLQVVCHCLWQALPEDAHLITREHLDRHANVRHALADFYERCVAEAVRETGVAEGRLRQWFTEQLITPVGTRAPVFRGPQTTGDIPNQVVDLLERRFLLRAELRGSQRWYELAHDRLIGPIRQANQQWLRKVGQSVDKTLQWLTASAAAEAAGTGGLLNQEELDEAERCLAVLTATGMLPDEEVQQYVDHSRAALREAARQRELEQARELARAQQRLKWVFVSLAAVAGALAVLAGGLALVAWRNATEATSQRQLADELREVAEANAAQTQHTLARRMVIQGMQQAQEGDLASALLWFEQAYLQDRELAEQMDTASPNAATGRSSAGLETHRMRLATILRQLPTLRDLEIFGEPRETSSVNTSAAVPGGHCLLLGGKPLPFAPAGAGPAEAILYDARSGQVTALPHGQEVRQVALSPDEAYAVTASEDGAASIWAVGDSGRRATVQHPVGPLLSLQIVDSADGYRLLTISADGAGRLWDLKAGAEVGRIDAPAGVGKLLRAAASPDGRHLLMIDESRRLYVWNLRDRELVRRVEHDYVPALTIFSPDSRHVLLAEAEAPPGRSVPRTGLWSLEGLIGGEPPAEVPHAARLLHAAFDSRSRLLATAGRDNVARLWRLDTQINSATGQSQITVAPIGDASGNNSLAHSNWVHWVAFSPDGRWVATASRDHTARVWEARSGTAVTPPLRHRGAVTQALFDGSGRHLRSISGFKTFDPEEIGREVRSWDLWTGDPQRPPLPYIEGLTQLAFNRRGDRIVTVARHGVVTADTLQQAALAVRSSQLDQVIVWDADAGQPLQELERGRSSLISVAEIRFAASGDCLLIISESRTAHVWNWTADPPVLWDVPPPRGGGSVAAADFSGDGRRLVVVYQPPPPMAPVESAAPVEPPRQEVVVWDVAASTELRRLQPANSAEDRVQLAALSHDGNRLVLLLQTRDPSDRWANAAQVWTIPGGESAADREPAEFPHVEPVLFAAFSRDARRLLTASVDDTASVWDLTAADRRRERQPLWRLKGHTSDVTYAAFDPSGQRVVTASRDGTARVWWQDDAGQLATVTLEHRQPVNSAEFSRADDGQLMLTTSDDQMITVWDPQRGEAVARLLRYGGRVRRAFFCERDRQRLLAELIVGDGQPRPVARSWGLQPVEYEADLARQILLLSAQKVENDLPVLTDTRGYAAAWRNVEQHLQMPDPDRSAVGWHQRQAADSEALAAWGAAAWHLERVIALSRGLPQTDPAEQASLRRLARALVQLEAPERQRAISIYTELIQAQPEDWTLRVARGEVHVRQQAWDEALADIDRALELVTSAEQRDELRRLSSAIHDRSNRIEESAAELDETELADRAAPAVAKAHVFLKMGEFEQAGDQFRRVTAVPLAAGPQRVPMLASNQLMAQSYARSGKWKDAIEGYDAALNLAPKDAPSPWLLSQRAAAYAQSGEFPRAVDDMQQAHQALPNDFQIGWQLALLRLRSGDREGYRRDCQELLRRFGDTRDIQIAERLAWICCVAPEAVEDFERVVELAEFTARGDAPSHSLVTHGAALCRAGEYDAAIDQLRRAREAARLEPGGSGRAAGQPGSDPGEARGLLFLALAHRGRGGEGDEQEFRRRREQAAAAFAALEAADAPPIPWPRRLELQLLLEETH